MVNETLPTDRVPEHHARQVRISRAPSMKHMLKTKRARRSAPFAACESEVD
jgi:hypothetical protein